MPFVYDNPKKFVVYYVFALVEGIAHDGKFFLCEDVAAGYINHLATKHDFAEEGDIYLDQVTMDSNGSIYPLETGGLIHHPQSFFHVIEANLNEAH